MQYKHTKIAALLEKNDRTDLTAEEKDEIVEELVREITALWQTDELRRKQPTPMDEARGGLHIVEQSLWAAVPNYLRRLSQSLKKHTGRSLPLDCVPIKFGSWMGGDRDGNPNVTASVTFHVACLGKWMACDLYLKEIDALRFELSMGKASPELEKLLDDIEKGDKAEHHHGHGHESNLRRQKSFTQHKKTLSSSFSNDWTAGGEVGVSFQDLHAQVCTGHLVLERMMRGCAGLGLTLGLGFHLGKCVLAARPPAYSSGLSFPRAHSLCPPISHTLLALVTSPAWSSHAAFFNTGSLKVSIYAVVVDIFLYTG